MRSAECGVRNAECGMRNAECGVRNAECGVRSAECVHSAGGDLRCLTLSCPAVGIRPRKKGKEQNRMLLHLCFQSLMLMAFSCHNVNNA